MSENWITFCLLLTVCQFFSPKIFSALPCTTAKLSKILIVAIWQMKTELALGALWHDGTHNFPKKQGRTSIHTGKVITEIPIRKENVHEYYMKCNNSFNTFKIKISWLLWVFTGVFFRLKSGNLTRVLVWTCVSVYSVCRTPRKIINKLQFSNSSIIHRVLMLSSTLACSIIWSDYYMEKEGSIMRKSIFLPMKISKNPFSCHTVTIMYQFLSVLYRVIYDWHAAVGSFFINIEPNNCAKGFNLCSM